MQTEMNDDINFLKSILPAHYVVKESATKGSIHCKSPIGIREGPRLNESTGRCINDEEDQEHWGYIFNAIKGHFADRFMEVDHNINFCHVDFTIYLRSLKREERIFAEGCCCEFNPVEAKELDVVLASNCCPVHNLNPFSCQKDCACTASPAPMIPAEKDIIQGLEEGAEQWKAEYDNCLAILSELVALKELKDKAGKTDEYIARQPLAWGKAKEFLNRYQH